MQNQSESIKKNWQEPELKSLKIKNGTQHQEAEYTFNLHPNSVTSTFS
ncbi:hypothetical protein V7S79_11700 [Aquirufa sp. ROCK-SH2]